MSSSTLPLPYYQDDAVTIYNGDCRELLPALSADVVITDPPYNVGILYGDGTDDTRTDYASWCYEWFGPCRQMAERVAISPGIENVGLWSKIEEPRWIIAWIKPAAMGRCLFGFTNWEPVLFWGKSPTQRGVDVFTAPIVPDSALEGHPCPKPLRWGSSLVALLSNAGETVLDPFAGSGTTLRAAKDQGRKAIGIEIEERFCELAAKRMGQEVLDLGAAA